MIVLPLGERIFKLLSMYDKRILKRKRIMKIKKKTLYATFGLSFDVK